MENRQQYPEDDPRHHTIKIRHMLTDTIDHLREDVGKVTSRARKRPGDRGHWDELS